jgi:cytochrome P450
MQSSNVRPEPATRLRCLADLPGPRPLPLLGNVHQFDLAHMHQALEAWSRQYGSFFRFRVGRRRVLGVADPSAIGAILRDRPDGFRRTSLLETVFREMGILGVFAANGEAWRMQRKMVAAALDTRHLKSYFPLLVRVTERLYRRWTLHAKRGVAFDLQADLMRYTVDVVAGLAFGIDMNTIESDGEAIQTHLNQVFPMLTRRLMAPVPYWRWLRLPADRALDRHLVAVYAAVADLIANGRERIARNQQLHESPSNLLEAMLIERESPDSTLTDHDVASNVVTLLLAGEDTTANTLAWLIYLASQDPAVTNRLAEEARRVLGSMHFIDRLELVSALSFTAASAQETMRMKPVAPLIILEAAVPKVVGGDIAIPAGTFVAAVMRKASMEERYIARPASFDPERWLAEKGTAASGERVSMPFGAGPRICPGRNLALLEIGLVVSMMFRNFEIAAIGPAEGDRVDECFAFTMGPSRLLVTLAPTN